MSRILISLLVVPFVFAYVNAGHQHHHEPKCEANAEPKSCGTLCEPTCEKPKKIFCTPAHKDSCKNECRCKDGYVRHNGKCIEVKDCPKPPQKCPAHESFKLCGRVKEPTCSHPKPEPCKAEECNKHTQGCRCEEGYVRDVANNRCIKVNDCPKPLQKCPAHESFNLCGRVKEPTCSNPKPEACKAEDCNKHTQGCRCEKGYVRDERSNRCIREKDCVKCGANEKVGACGRKCERTCKNRGPVQCPPSICKDRPHCQCKEGFYRNEETDKCIPEDQCPKKCGYGEIYAACGQKCEGCCESPTLPEDCKRMKCSTQECRCDLDRGFVRDEKTKKCVHKDKCSKCHSC